jgi:Holliday junction resolvase RusA-like endonuclease
MSEISDFSVTPHAAAGLPESARASAGDITPVGASTGGLPWLELDLPTPPSVNRFMGKLGNKSPVVRYWLIQADRQLMTQKRCKITGAYEVEFVFNRRGRGDLDNRIKPLMDYLQRIELIQNDRLCEKLMATWGESMGVKVRLRPWMVPYVRETEERHDDSRRLRLER